MIVTIDGPAGSGKSTVAQLLAQRLGWAYLDTGAMYRAVALLALRAGVDLSDPEALGRCARGAEVKLLADRGDVRVLLNGRDVSGEIRTAEVTDHSHFVADVPGVREVLVATQRRIARELGDVVTEGRDQGSVVFPDAEVKFFLTAAAGVRARRRYEQMRAGGEEISYERIHDAIVARDHRDRRRRVGPLVKPAGAVEVDTGEMTAAQAVDFLARHVRSRL